MTTAPIPFRDIPPHTPNFITAFAPHFGAEVKASNAAPIPFRDVPADTPTLAILVPIAARSIRAGLRRRLGVFFKP